MSDTYFCMFCDAIILSAVSLRVHLIQHLDTDDGDDDDIDCDLVDEFVTNFVKYEIKVNESLLLRPQVLPEDNVSSLLMGCPVCDAIVRCFDLVTNASNRNRCLCQKSSSSAERPHFRCVQCRQYVHKECAIDSGVKKCYKCLTKRFEISYLKVKCHTYDAQREHCYRHLNYYPFRCLFKSHTTSGDKVCGHRLFSIKTCETHLQSEHNYPIDVSKDNILLMTKYFDFKCIQKIENLINTQLNSKSLPLLPIDSDITIESIIANRPVVATNANNNCFALNHCGEEMVKSEDESDGQSFKFMTQTMAKTSHLSRKKTTKKMRKQFSQFVAEDDGHKCWSTPQRSEYSLNMNSSENSKMSPYLQSLINNEIESQTPRQKIGRRGRPRGRPPKDRTINMSPIITVQDVLEMGEVSDFEEEVTIDEQLIHRQLYSNWFTQTKRTKMPYFAQKDDEVYYLPFGHQLYKDRVMATHLYNQSNQNYTIRCHKNDKILAKVAKIDFLFKERRQTNTVIRCIYVTLRPIGADKEKYGTIIHVKYHDMEGVDDFMVLREHYETSVAKEWSIGERFRAIVDDHYWFGEVVGLNDNENCRETMFKKYRIRWLASSAVDLLSPWDMEAIDDGVGDFDAKSSVPVTFADRQAFFTSKPEEWPQFNEKRELKRVANGLKIILNMDKTKEFSLLSDITDSRYKEKILYPVDMKTFIQRVENRFYRRHLAIKYDIKFMEANVRKLVKSVKRDPIYRFDEVLARRLKYHTKFVTALCLLFIDTHECQNPYDLYHNIDDYLETHDVKCYSAKRVHLNKRKKHPNILPTVQKRLAKRPQSFGDARKVLKIREALRNTSADTIGYKSKAKKSFPSHKSVPVAVKSVPFAVKSRPSYPPPPKEMAKHDVISRYDINGSDNDITGRGVAEETNYSSDVSYSENENNVLKIVEDSEDSKTDPDFKTSYYNRDKF